MMPASRPPRLARALLLLERGLLVLAIVALGWYTTSRVRTAVYQAWQDRELERMRHERQSGSTGREDVIMRTAASRDPVGRALIGRIEVPRLGVSAIVRTGVEADTLDRAVGHIPGTALPGETGNVALAAHRDTFFRPLKGIRGGDRVVLTTPDGTFDYVVRDTRVVEPTDVSVLEATAEPTLTLVTCYPFNFVGSAPMRFVVRAERADVPSRPAPARAVVASAVTAPGRAVAASARTVPAPQRAATSASRTRVAGSVAKRARATSAAAPRKGASSRKAPGRSKPRDEGLRLVFVFR